jgi:hypothetical protein
MKLGRYESASALLEHARANGRLQFELLDKLGTYGVSMTARHLLGRGAIDIEWNPEGACIWLYNPKGTWGYLFSGLYLFDNEEDAVLVTLAAR